MDTTIPVERDSKRQDAPVGILRAEGSTRTRRIPSDLRLSLQVEPSSPQPSVDRLSVTFAEESIKSDSSARFNLFSVASSLEAMDKVHFSTATDQEDTEDEDYSASVNAIIQRKASQRRSKRRSKRRTSSPYSPDILTGSQVVRRASIFTTSSGDTAITMDDAPGLELTQEQIFENIRLHKEVLTNVKMQPWNMRRKLKLVMQAKSYVKRHEGALQERFTQTHSLKNILARWNIYLIKKWQHYRREIANISNWLIPWERRIKEIESHFGSVVASYFIFLRWLFWVNIVISVILLAFVVLPEVIITTSDSNPVRKKILPEDKYNSTNFLTLWDFEGVLKYTPVFYGWYTNKDLLKLYRLPLAYFITQLVVYIYSFVTTLRKMAANSRMSKLSEKGDESVFTWKVFTGWDYMIGNAETAQNRVMSIIMGFKEALLEEAEKQRKARNWRVISRRVFVNVTVLGLFALSAAAVVEVVRRSTEPEANSSIWRRNETSIIMTCISFIFPNIMDCLGLMEQYHPRKQLRIQLARIMLLNLLNLYSLIFAQFDKISDMSIELLKFKSNGSALPTAITNDLELFTRTSSEVVCRTVCFNVTRDLEDARTFPMENLVASVTASVATTAFPKLLSVVNTTAPSTTEYWNFTEINGTTSEEYPLLLNGFVDGFQDYLNYILGTIDLRNGTNLTEITTDLTTDAEESTYTSLKTTVATVLRTTTEEITEHYEEEFSTFYDEVTGTIAALSQECEEICESVAFSSEEAPVTASAEESTPSTYELNSKLRSLCWETMFGQELVKLTVMDTVFTIAGTVGMDFFRGVFVRAMNKCWCWDLEKKFPEYGEFKVAENILHLVHNQGMVWMGMFFAPGIVAINVGKLILLMYLRSWAVLTCNVPHAVVFRASRSNNFYFALLLIMLFLCVLPVGYAIVGIKPSWHCGPFSRYKRIYHILTETVRRWVPPKLQPVLDYIVSPGIVIPILVLLVLIIYYLISLTNSLREANADLKIQLRQERTEERRKMFQIADRRRRGGSGCSNDLDNTPFARWKKLIHSLPTGKSTDDSSHKNEKTSEAEREHRAKEVVVRFLRRRMQQARQSTNEAVEKPSSVETKREEWQQCYRKSSLSNSSKDTRQDSVCSSNWSENIPVITISKSDSSESVLEDVADGSSPKRTKRLLKKQSEISPEDDSEDGLASDDSSKTTVKSINFDKSSSGHTHTKTDNDFE